MTCDEQPIFTPFTLPNCNPKFLKLECEVHNIVSKKNPPALMESVLNHYKLYHKWSQEDMNQVRKSFYSKCIRKMSVKTPSRRGRKRKRGNNS